MSAVRVENIRKTYDKGAVTAVDGLTFEVQRGELFGLIGPDGAGKTSLFRMLTTLLLPDGGTATVDGYDIVKDYKTIRNRVGYMPGRFSLYQDLTVEENLTFFATVFGTSIDENYDLVKDIYKQIEPFKDRRAGKLSGGMKQKLALSCALIHRPSVLFLDEPTTGVDSVSRKEFWEMLRRLKEQNITILVSTPYMDEATLCDRIALMQAGKVLSVASPADTVKSFRGQLFSVAAKDIYRLLKDIRGFHNTGTCFAFGETLHVTFAEEHAGMKEALLAYLQEMDHRELRLEKIEPGIEDCFIQLMKT